MPVEVGMYSDRLIEIKSGLEAGDMVLLSASARSDNIDLTGSIVGAEGIGTNRTLFGKTNGTAKVAGDQERVGSHARALTTAGREYFCRT